jgi:prepilin-type N-terminal cleavage/methylation domain-containing protein
MLLTRSRSTGFSLIELLVVIFVTSILSAVSIPTMMNQTRRARTAEGDNAMTSVVTALTVYAFDCSTFAAGSLTTLNSGFSCGGPHSGPWLEQSWTAIAPNYSTPTFAVANSSGARLTTGGISTTSYAAITCQKGAGDLANSMTDGCKY